MMSEILQALEQILGIGVDNLNWYQASARAFIIYIAALMMVRIGEKRFLGKNTAFDVILGIILGSVVSRAINGSAALFTTILAGTALVAVHWLFSYLAFRSDKFGDLVKGNKRRLVQDGQIQWQEMEESHISEADLMSQVRYAGKQESLSSVETAYLERSGDISVIPRPASPKILEVQVAEGVQTVRIRIE